MHDSIIGLWNLWSILKATVTTTKRYTHYFRKVLLLSFRCTTIKFCPKHFWQICTKTFLTFLFFIATRSVYKLLPRQSKQSFSVTHSTTTKITTHSTAVCKCSLTCSNIQSFSHCGLRVRLRGTVQEGKHFDASDKIVVKVFSKVLF